MGWTSKTYTKSNHETFNTMNALELCNYELVQDGYLINAFDFIKAKNENYHHVVYLVMTHPKKYRFGMVVLIDIVDDEILWKEMDETQGPCEDDCPSAMIRALSPTKNEYANAWRKRCLQKNIEYKHSFQNM